MARLTTVPEALDVVRGLVRPGPSEVVAIGNALGRVASTSVVAACELPRFDNSAMDGFAVRAGDTTEARASRPVVLDLAGEVGAGSPAPTIGPAQAIRVATGAPVPAGADAIVRLEACEVRSGKVLVTSPVPVGADVRHRGSDVVAGQELVPAGTLLGPGQLAAASGTGSATLTVYRRPRLHLVVTGDEVRPAGSALGPSEVHDVVGPTLQAWGTALHADVLTLEYVRDDPDELSRALRGSDEADLVITVGGVSVGHRDHLRACVDDVALWGVALRPGKPFAAGTVAGRVWLGLPGNPAAALAAFELFGRAAIERGGGRSPRGGQEAELAGSVRPDPHRTRMLRARAWRTSDGGLVATPSSSQGASSLASLAELDVWVVVGPGDEELHSGARVTVRTVPGRPIGQARSADAQ